MSNFLLRLEALMHGKSEEQVQAEFDKQGVSGGKS
jgi:glucose-6-phosphate isomerase